MSKLEDMMKKDGWKLKYCVNKNVKYFSFHKNGFEISRDDICEVDNLREWKEIVE